MMVSLCFSAILLFSLIALCCGSTPSSTTAAGCIVYSLNDGGESAPWPWPVGTQAAISLLPEFPGEPLRSLHVTLNSHRQDHVIYFDQYGNVICRDGGRRESSFHQIPANASTQLVYQWYHAIVEWQGGTLSINGHDVCSGMHLSHDIYNITLKYSEANGFAVFGCYPGCPLWSHSQLKLYKKPLPTESALASRNNLQHPISISLIVDRCYSKYQANCNKTITLNHGIRNHWVKIGWRNIVEVRVGDMTQSVDGVDDNGAGENGMQVILEDSSNVLWTFLSPTCTTEMVQMEGTLEQSCMESRLKSGNQKRREKKRMKKRKRKKIKRRKEEGKRGEKGKMKKERKKKIKRGGKKEKKGKEGKKGGNIRNED